MYGFKSQACNNSDSVDFDFFNSEGEQIKVRNKDSSQIITKAIIETRHSNLKKSTFSSEDFKEKETIKNSECTKILKDVNCALSKVKSHSLSETQLTKVPLTNCLAYANEKIIGKSSDSLNFDDKECSDNSLSDSTLTSITSELTSVSPCSLMSDSSSLFEESRDPSISQNVDDCIETRSTSEENIAEAHGSKQDMHESNGSDLFDEEVKNVLVNDKSICCQKVAEGSEFLKENENDVHRERENTDISIIEEELGCLSLTNQSSTSSIPRSLMYRGPSKIKMKKKESNLTFNREEIFKIERDNLILLKKIMAHSKPKAVTLNYPFTHKKTSAAINRARQQKKIEQDNYVSFFSIVT